MKQNVYESFLNMKPEGRFVHVVENAVKVANENHQNIENLSYRLNYLLKSKEFYSKKQLSTERKELEKNAKESESSIKKSVLKYLGNSISSIGIKQNFKEALNGKDHYLVDLEIRAPTPRKDFVSISGNVIDTFKEFYPLNYPVVAVKAEKNSRNVNPNEIINKILKAGIEISPKMTFTDSNQFESHDMFWPKGRAWLEEVSQRPERLGEQFKEGKYLGDFFLTRRKLVDSNGKDTAYELESCSSFVFNAKIGFSPSYVNSEIEYFITAKRDDKLKFPEEEKTFVRNTIRTLNI